MRFIHIGAVHSIPQCLLEIFAVRFLIICLLNTLSLFPSLRWMCRTSVASKIFMVLIACSRIQRRHQTLSRIPKTISTYHPWHSTIIFCKTTLSFHLHNVSSDTYILMQFLIALVQGRHPRVEKYFEGHRGLQSERKSVGNSSFGFSFIPQNKSDSANI